ncbi:MAG: hypothetical protein LBB18_01865 [Puniceicoccales bacterium]|nr:hypothetical protein [Puniceicoccales bacterium]
MKNLQKQPENDSIPAPSTPAVSIPAPSKQAPSTSKSHVTTNSLSKNTSATHRFSTPAPDVSHNASREILGSRNKKKITRKSRVKSKITGNTDKSTANAGADTTRSSTPALDASHNTSRRKFGLKSDEKTTRNGDGEKPKIIGNTDKSTANAGGTPRSSTPALNA